MMKRALILTGLLVALPAVAEEAAPAPAPATNPAVCPVTGQPLGPGPWWQSAEAAAKQQEVRTAVWALAALQTAEPRDEAAITAKQAEVDRLRQELYTLRTEERQQLGAGLAAPMAGAANWARGAGMGRGMGMGMGRGGGWRAGGGRGWCGGRGGRGGGWGGQGNPNCPYR